MKTLIICFSTVFLALFFLQCKQENKTNNTQSTTKTNNQKSATTDDDQILFVAAPPSVASYGFASIHDLAFTENIMSFTVGLNGYALGAPTSVKPDRNQRIDPKGQYYSLYLNGAPGERLL